MLNLEPLIARLVEDVLRAIGSLTLEELRDLIAPSTTALPRKSPTVPHVPVPSRRAKRPLPRRPLKSPPATVSDPGTAAVRAIPELPAGADITDPDRLLATASPPQQVLPAAEVGVPVSEDEPPSSTVRPVFVSGVSLRPGERLASPSGASIVIRRAKKAKA
jgi:hypothetical protein